MELALIELIKTLVVIIVAVASDDDPVVNDDAKPNIRRSF